MSSLTIFELFKSSKTNRTKIFIWFKLCHSFELVKWKYSSAKGLKLYLEQLTVKRTFTFLPVPKRNAIFDAGASKSGNGRVTGFNYQVWCFCQLTVDR